MRLLPVTGTLHEVTMNRDLTYLDVRRVAIAIEGRSNCTVLFTSLLLPADLRALIAHRLEEMRWRRWAVDLVKLAVDTGHAVDTTSSKDKRVVVSDLEHDIESSELDPPPNGGAMIDRSDVGPEATDELVGLHPREIWHVSATLKSQLPAWLIILQQESQKEDKTGKNKKVSPYQKTICSDSLSTPVAASLASQSSPPSPIEPWMMLGLLPARQDPSVTRFEVWRQQ